ncbi:hypothetical protein [Azospirillum sp. Sh1]|uniref:hypothetical protein n=1 Tax=Azospirillum sp. Sh1 TaxID=2607285 RepID=UPI0011EBE67E|nr:hypothetical protein [Azospirillum sp. Sh1]KAA0569436.1 hypothetical protein FZ029_32570 [Azospirillum sp. Sh1]
MVSVKTEQMMVRFRPEVRALLAELAAADSRSMAGELEALIRAEARCRGLADGDGGGAGWPPLPRRPGRLQKCMFHNRCSAPGLCPVKPLIQFAFAWQWKLCGTRWAASDQHLVDDPLPAGP